MILRATTAAAIIAATSSFATAANNDVLLGKWLTEDGGTVEIKSCKSGLCGDIVDIKIPAGKTRKDMVDANNPTEAKRGRSLYGLRVVRRIQPDGPQKWSARAYSPKHGHSGDTTLTLRGPDTLKLRGCVQAVFKICKTETWHRM